MRRGQRALLWILVGSIVGCGGEATEPTPGVRAGPPGTLSLPMLEADVQPMLDRLCAQSACHGDPNRRFFLYSSFGARMESPLEGLTEAELSANLERCADFLVDLDDVADSELLSRPLRGAEGGTPHGGGDQFFDRADPSYVLLACWLTGRDYRGLECQP